LKKLKLSDSGARGWFIGDFPEAVIRTQDFEVCYQVNAAGTPCPRHYHNTVTELQLITRGCMILNGEEYRAGDICIVEPGEVTEGMYTEDTDTVAVKFPSLPQDKYYV
jgi:quercetin dioxygenase-like cupin family protein